MFILWKLECQSLPYELSFSFWNDPFVTISSFNLFMTKLFLLSNLKDWQVFLEGEALEWKSSLSISFSQFLKLAFSNTKPFWTDACLKYYKNSIRFGWARRVVKEIIWLNGDVANRLNVIIQPAFRAVHSKKILK